MDAVLFAKEKTTKWNLIDEITESNTTFKFE